MGCLGRRFAIGKEEVLMDPRVWMGVTVTGLPGTTPLLPPPAPASDNVGTRGAHAASGQTNLTEGVEPRRIFQKFASIKNKEPSSSPCCRSFLGKLE
jgi:hypothetical protein